MRTTIKLNFHQLNEDVKECVVKSMAEIILRANGAYDILIDVEVQEKARVILEKHINKACEKGGYVYHVHLYTEDRIIKTVEWVYEWQETLCELTSFNTALPELKGLINDLTKSTGNSTQKKGG